MRRKITDVLDVVGIVALVKGAAELTQWAGWLAAGVGVMLVSNTIARRGTGTS